MTPIELIYFLNSKNITLIPESLKTLSGGKDNITYAATLLGWAEVIIQCMRSVKSTKHQEFLESAIDFIALRHSDIGFVPSVPGIPRFYTADDCSIQIMQKVFGKNATEWDVSVILIEEIASRLAKLHNYSQEFSTESYADMNFHRDKVSVFKEQAEDFVKTYDNLELKELIKTYNDYYNSISLKTDGIRKGLIHGDPVYKNFLIDATWSVTAWIDYDMLSVTYQLWDLADMYRWYTKIPEFSREYALLALKSYESIHPLTFWERGSLPDYIRMMTLDTGYRYILALDTTSGFYNAIWNSLEKAKRCLRDFERVQEWF